MNDERMNVIMGLIMNGGNAKSHAFQAIQLAKQGEFNGAHDKIKEADSSLKSAHDVQTDMLTKEAQGEHTEIDLYMLHAQDHLMNGITFRDIAVEIIDLYERLDS
ncbi:PTS cellobiose transporter subunit IIA [Leuconostoc mesenteroides P45]|uniref:PTS lactose/cellobiose transporter subunit IIA n=1 Tax=Leuconostoc mesenteroides TaxID=1245 RepID=UPI000500DFE8|nr:PTS lactose/cellobiose transporter subunit IIA [Leuconostoc mesenteroides]KGB49678.1 PTS cellobiose transporter subunit IIA [Leuconostoc mesenteroides P45]